MGKKKLLITVLIVAVLISTLMFSAAAAQNIKVLIDGKEISFDVLPQIIDGRTMVPMRAIFEALGAEVNWDGDTRSITAIKGDIVIIMQIDNNAMKTGGASLITLDVPPQIVNGRTLVPLRAVAEALNVKVDWEDRTRAVYISTNISNNGPPSYVALMNEWKSALRKYKNGEHTGNDILSFTFYDMADFGVDASSTKAYCALYDIDGNGIQELILRKVTRTEDIIAYIFSIKNGEAVNVFGSYDDGILREVPWSRVGSSAILSNGLIDSISGDYSIYKIADDGCSIIELASSEPYDYPDMASIVYAKWRYYIYSALVDYDYYVQYLDDHGYKVSGANPLAVINWVEID